VVEWDFFIAHRDADSVVAEQLATLLRPHARVFEDSMLPPGVDWDVLGRHQRSALITVVLVTAQGVPGVFYREEIATGLRLAQRDPDGHRVVPVLLEPVAVDDMPYGLMIKNAILAGGTVSLSTVAERLLYTLRDMPASRAPGPVEVAAATMALLSAIDEHLRGNVSDDGAAVTAVLDELNAGSAFTDQLRRHGLEPAVLLTFVREHARALEEWRRGDDGTAAAWLGPLREHLARAIESGGFPVPPLSAASVATTLRGTASADVREALARMVNPPRSTSLEIVLLNADSAAPVADGGSDPRRRLLSDVARRMCALPAADVHFGGPRVAARQIDDDGRGSPDLVDLWAGRRGVVRPGSSLGASLGRAIRHCAVPRPVRDESGGSPSGPNGGAHAAPGPWQAPRP